MINKLIKLNPKILNKIFNYYTAGQNINSLCNKIQIMENMKMLPIVDYIKENVKNNKDVQSIIIEYKDLSKLNDINFIAIKLSSFNYDFGKIYQTCDYMINNNKKILIDAEEVDVQSKIENITNDLITVFNKDNVNIYKTYQMYRVDSYNNLINDFNKFDNLGIKIVRGAYYSKDKNTGLLFKTKKETDESFSKGMQFIFENVNKKNINTFICTHNINNIKYILDNYNSENNHHINSINHASLYGFINNETNSLIKKNIKTYKYLPYGNYNDSIPYLIRRIEENPKILKYLF